MARPARMRPAPRIERATGRQHPPAHDDQGDLMTSTTPSAGGILAAADALQGPQQTFTREQVAYLMHLAYDSGRTARHLDDVAELHAGWARHPRQANAAQQRYRERMAEMAAQAAQVNAELGRPPGYRYDGGPVDWETGRPLRGVGQVTS